MKKQLTAYQESMAREMLKGHATNSDAYRASLYPTEGKSNTQIGKQASEVLNSPYMRDRIAELMASRNKRTEIDEDYVLTRLRDIDELDILDIMNDDMSVKPLKEWPKVWRTTVASVDITELFAGSGDERALMGFIKKLKMPDKLKNLELMGKHVRVQAWKEKTEVEHTGLTDILKDIKDGHILPGSQ